MNQVTQQAQQDPPEGVFGGSPGARAQFLVNGVPGNPYGLTQLKPGDAVTIDAAGGGPRKSLGPGFWWVAI